MSRESTLENVLLELTGNYQVDEETAKKLIVKHIKIYSSAQRMGSFAYYPAQKIAEAENLEYTGILDKQEESKEEENED